MPSLELMTTNVKDLAKAVVQLPANERAFLAEELLASLDDAELEKSWTEEAKRRRDDVRSGRVKPVEADDVYRRIDAILNE
jgi:putative addiction module component (TIGR02574 family)